MMNIILLHDHIARCSFYEKTILTKPDHSFVRRGGYDGGLRLEYAGDKAADAARGHGRELSAVRLAKSGNQGLFP